jgi:MFS transporter, SP family, sugar:H+ symporter
MIATLTMVGQQLMGIAFISGYYNITQCYPFREFRLISRSYSTYFFALVGLGNAFEVTVIVNACQIAGPLLAFIVVRKIGRRPLLIGGAAVCGFCMLAFASVAQGAPNSPAAAKCLITFICIFFFTYAGTWGSVGPVVMGEVPSNRLRSKSVSIALSFAWVFCLAIICSIPYLLSPEYANLGTKLGFVFGSLTVAVLVATILILPETKGIPLLCHTVMK